MSRPLILLDMDGVIANFVQGIIDSHQLGITHEQYTSWDYHREIGIPDSEFWEPTKTDGWWENLQPYPYAEEFVAALREVADIIFCTSPSADDKCPSEKVRWLRKHGFMGSNNEYQIGPRKELNARSGAILIDDSESNVDKYGGAGGTAILFPQPWNPAWQGVWMPDAIVRYVSSFAQHGHF